MCVLATAQYLVGVTRTELLLALVSECQSVFTDYVKLCFISERSEERRVGKECRN